MAEDPAPGLEWFELAEALWLQAYQTIVAPLSDRRDALQPRPFALPTAPDEQPEPPARPGPFDRSAGEAPGGGRPGPEPGPPRGLPAPHLPAYGTAVPGTLAPGAEPARGGRWMVRAWDRAAERRAEPLPELRDAAEISRRLRLFKKLVPSRLDVELDELSTAERAAEDGMWLPYTRPKDERWLDLVLVVDDHSTMAIWRRTITEFTALTEQLGAFRDVRVRYLGVRGEREPVLHGPVSDSADSDSRTAPASLVDPGGRRLILVLSDGLGEVWQSGAAEKALALWAAKGPVAVVHMLSMRDWHRTHITPRQVRVRAPGPAAPNERLTLDFPPEHHNPFDPHPAHWTVAVPVLELDAEWLGWWARLVSGAETGPVDASVLLLGADEAGTRAPADEDLDDEAEPSVKDRIRRFRSHASPTAFRLATHLAAAPLELPLIQAVQRQLVPESQPAHLAELFLSGLLTDVPSTERSSPVSNIPLDFVDGAREELLSAAKRADTARVVSSVSEYYGDRVAAVQQLRTALLAPEDVPDPPVTDDTLPFVRVELAVLRALSGPYLRRARRISDALESVHSGTPSGSGPEITYETGPVVHDEQHNPDTDGLIMTETTANQEHSDDAPQETAPPGQRVAAVVDRPHAFSSSAAARGSVQHENQTGRNQPAVWGNVPPNNPNFTGREDLLAQVREQLTSGDTAAVLPHTLHGMGGVGKSQIAIEYVYRYASDYDVVWWIPSEQPGMILTALTDLANRLGLRVGSEANTAVPAVREALRSGDPFRKWLLVFDNAEKVETVRPYFPTGGTGKILITSRNQEWDRVARTLSVDVFTREESKALLRRRARDLTDTDADLLAAALGDLPLAIEQAAAWQAVTGMAVPEYLRLINEKIAELMLELVPSPDYPMSVAAAWDVSLRQLAQRNPAALQLLQVCSFFAPEPITRSLFNNSRTTTIAPELDETLRNPIKLARAIREINIYALARIEYRHDTIQLHRLVQAVLVNRMSPQQQAEMRHGAHLLLADANPNDPSSREIWPRYQALLPHVMVSRAVECESPWVRKLVSGMVQFLYSWGDHEGARDLAREALNIWTEKFGDEDQQTLEIAKWLAFILRLLGEFPEAITIIEKTAATYVRIAGEEDEGTLDALIQLCGALRVKGQFAEAHQIIESVYERSLRAFGEDDPATLRASHSLGVGLRLLGRFSDAYVYDVETARQRALVLGENYLDTLNTLNSISMDLRETGDYLGAVSHQEMTYTRHVESFGAENPASVKAARILAVCRRRAGDHSGALQLAELTLKQFQSRYGSDYPDTMACAADLVVDLRQDRQLRRSKELGEESVERYTDKFGAGHPYTLSARINLAITLRLLGDSEAAGPHAIAAVAGLDTSLGRDHILTLTAMVGMANHHAATGEFEEALTLDEETLEALVRTVGENHPTTLACSNNLALDLRALGRDDDAAARHADTLTRFRETLGTSHPATIAAASSQRAEADVASVPF